MSEIPWLWRNTWLGGSCSQTFSCVYRLEDDLSWWAWAPLLKNSHCTPEAEALTVWHINNGGLVRSDIGFCFLIHYLLSSVTILVPWEWPLSKLSLVQQEYLQEDVLGVSPLAKTLQQRRKHVLLQNLTVFVLYCQVFLLSSSVMELVPNSTIRYCCCILSRVSVSECPASLHRCSALHCCTAYCVWVS